MGEYLLDVVDANGQVLWSQPFSLSFDYEGPMFLGIDYSGINYESRHISFRIPYRSGMSELRLYHGARLILSYEIPVGKVYMPIISKNAK